MMDSRQLGVARNLRLQPPSKVWLGLEAGFSHAGLVGFRARLILSIARKSAVSFVDALVHRCISAQHSANLGLMQMR